MLVHMGLFSIRLNRVYQLAKGNVKYERYSQYHYSGTRGASGRLKSMAIQLLNSSFRLTTKKYQRFVLLFMYGEQNNTRLCKVAMVVLFDTVLCGANKFDHGRHINCNGTRQYQPKGNYYMRHAKYLVSPSHDGVMTSKRFPCC